MLSDPIGFNLFKGDNALFKIIEHSTVFYCVKVQIYFQHVQQTFKFNWLNLCKKVQDKVAEIQ